MKKHQIEESVYVGDTLKDQAASQESNIPFIWAKYGYGTGIQAEYEMNKITEIKKILERILEE